MITCLGDALYPRVGVAAVQVLRDLGVAVDFPAGQTCCGQPAYNSGFRDSARSTARAFLRAFAGSESVVSISGSCAAMVRDGFPDLF
ncbi:MAG TPA: (Fe-S)-binding protein, partial [Thermoleophilia bacterium]|nr:(Fe-S)-binding protein [Thermoleophilia bacterium]